MTVYPVFDSGECTSDFLVGLFSSLDDAEAYVRDNEDAYDYTLYIGQEHTIDSMVGFNIASVVAQALS